MKIFASELSKCRVWKAVYGWLSVVLGFILFIIVPLWYFLALPIEKTEEDFVREYVMQRMNFTPDRVGEAYHSPLQYEFPLYETVIKDEVAYAIDRQIYQVFSMRNVVKAQDGGYVANGRLVRISCLNQCEKVYDKFVKIIISQPRAGKFIVKEIKESY